MTRKVIWSWWDAVSSSCDRAGGSVCGPLSGAECCGQRILLPYNWRAGKYYRLRIWAVGDYPDGTREWLAAVRESGERRYSPGDALAELLRQRVACVPEPHHQLRVLAVPRDPARRPGPGHNRVGRHEGKTR